MGSRSSSRTRAVFASRCDTGSNFFPLCLNGAAAAFQGRSDLIGAPFFILWKLCSAQQCRTRAKLFSTDAFIRSPALSVLLILLLAMPLAGSDRSQLRVRLTLRPCRKEWLAVIRPPDWLRHSSEESALLPAGQDKVGFALDVAFSFVRKSFSQSLL